MAAKTETGKAKARATQDIEDIDSLKGNAAFKRYFERRVLGELNTLREKVLYDKALDRDALWEARLKFLALFDISNMLLQDESACKRMFEEAGD